MPLVLLRSDPALTAPHQAALALQFSECPARLRAANIYCVQLRAQVWPYGGAAEWSSNGSISLKAGEWHRYPGLFKHALGHAAFHVIVGAAGRAEWERFCEERPRDLPPLVVARKDNPDERFSELFVAVYTGARRRPRGYRKPSAEAEAIMRRLMGE